MPRFAIPRHDEPRALRGNLPADSGVTVVLFHNALSLRDQIAIARHGGHAIQTRQLSEVNYDEDDVFDVDPVMNNLDRFERAEAISGTISERLTRKNKDRLDEVRV